MFESMGKHVKRAADDIARGVKKLNNRAVDVHDRNVHDKEESIQTLKILEAEFKKLKMEELVAKRNTDKMKDTARDVNEGINDVIKQGKIVELGIGASGF
jgi:hypothetical protein